MHPDACGRPLPRLEPELPRPCGGKNGDHLRIRNAGWAARAVAAAGAGLLLVSAAGAGLPSAGLAQVDRRDVDARVEALLREMTLEEKVGQMTQLTLQAVSRSMATASAAHQLDPDRLEEAVLRYHVGSILNVWDVAFTPRHWAEVTGRVQDASDRSRLRIPVLYGIDAVHGHHYLQGATVFPQNLALAATWNPALVRRANEITALETRASGIPWNFSPVLDVMRQPLWSRAFETFGEDVHLARTLGVAAVEGLQGASVAAPDRVAATGKHFVGYSAPRTGRDRTSAWIPERQLREYFLPTFQAAMAAGLKTVMINSADVNGMPVHASREILTDLLRTELGFEGVAVTDWEDVRKLHELHRVAPTPKDAVRMAVMAGIDMAMVPYDYSFTTHLLELVREGSVPESRIDESVRRILRLKFELGLFDDRRLARADTALLGQVGSPAFHAVSRAAAEEAVTLLRNEGDLLPLSRQARLLVTGPGATYLPAMYGSWTYTWQGTEEAMYPGWVKSPLAAVQAEIGAERVTYVPGGDLLEAGALSAAARGVDAAIVFLAERPSTEKPGDIEDLTLPRGQLELVRAVQAAGKPVVLVLFQNRPRIVREVVDGSRAILLGYQTGPFGGEAVADILFGDVNPSGRLPFTYPRATGALTTYDRAYSEEIGASAPAGGYDPEWEFGHGLSYTRFGYDGLRLGDRELTPDGTLEVSVTVANSGRRAGREVVQLYVRDLYASITPAMRRLRAFEKIELRPGERRVVRFRVPVREIAFVGRDNRWVVEPGEFEVQVGGETARFHVR